MNIAVKPKVRSAVSNGKRRFVGPGDGRGVWDRRRRDLEATYISNMGGVDRLSGYQIGLAQVAATLRIELEALEAKLSLGESVDLDLYARVASHYRRVCETLGLARVAKDALTLQGYLAARGKERELDEAAE